MYQLPVALAIIGYLPIALHLSRVPYPNFHGVSLRRIVTPFAIIMAVNLTVAVISYWFNTLWFYDIMFLWSLGWIVIAPFWNRLSR